MFFDSFMSNPVWAGSKLWFSKILLNLFLRGWLFFTHYALNYNINGLTKITDLYYYLIFSPQYFSLYYYYFIFYEILITENSVKSDAVHQEITILFDSWRVSGQSHWHWFTLIPLIFNKILIDQFLLIKLYPVGSYSMLSRFDPVRIGSQLR